MIKSVIFDLGGVIVPFDLSRAFAGLEARCGYGVDEIRSRIRATDLVTRFESGQIDPEPFVAQLCGVLDLRMTYPEFTELWNSIFFPDPLIPESLLEHIHRERRLVLLSNTNAIHYEMIARNYPLLRQFDSHVLSYQVGALKPSPVIYQAAIAASQCDAGECFFTDDIAAYVEGAKQAGIDAVQFVSLPQIEGQLRARGIL